MTTDNDAPPPPIPPEVRQTALRVARQLRDLEAEMKALGPGYYGIESILGICATMIGNLGKPIGPRS